MQEIEVKFGVAIGFLFACATLHADFTYQLRVRIDGQQPVVTTRSIKGTRLAILTRKHTEVIDLDTETITAIDYAAKTYSVTPFARWKQILADAAAQMPHETGFTVTRRLGHAPAKPIGVISADESGMDIAGASSGLSISLDTWVGTVPGYEQMRDFTDRLAAKLGYTFAAGLAAPVLQLPEESRGLALEGFDEALKELNQSHGAPIETSIKIMAKDQSVAGASIELSKFAGGAVPIATFTVPDGFKKVEP